MAKALRLSKRCAATIDTGGTAAGRPSTASAVDDQAGDDRRHGEKWNRCPVDDQLARRHVARSMTRTVARSMPSQRSPGPWWEKRRMAEDCPWDQDPGVVPVAAETGVSGGNEGFGTEAA